MDGRRLTRFALSALMALSLTAAPPARFASADEPPTHSCNWVSKAALNDAGNWLWPDEAADYVLGVFVIPRGGHVELKGRFPHARYLSFQSFDLLTRAFDLVQDFEIQPDPGSSNPFTTGADRKATNRSYTLKIVEGRVPTGTRPPNTIYTKSRTGSPSLPGVAIVLVRSYLPDVGRDSTGDVGWPTVTSVAANGTRRQSATCPAPQLPLVVTPLLKNLSIPGPAQRVQPAPLVQDLGQLSRTHPEHPR